MVKSIGEERERIDGYRFALGAAEFFTNRKYKPDLEWLILSYLTTALSAAGWECPTYAEKLEPPQPDFQTYLTRGVPYHRVEVTEVLRPEYLRGDFHRQVALSGERIHNIPNPHPQPWLSFHHVLHSKLAKSYSDGSWLVIYHDMPDSEFPDYIPWHDRVLSRLRGWTSDSASTCDITKSKYDSIFVVDASGIGTVRLHPHWDIIRESPFLS